jgi:hypothetical protein
LSTEAPTDFDEYEVWTRQVSVATIRCFHAIVDASTGQAVGVAAFLRIDTVMGVIEVGHITGRRRSSALALPPKPRS